MKFRFDVSGRGSPHGNMITYPGLEASVTVTFNTADVAPLLESGDPLKIQNI